MISEWPLVLKLALVDNYELPAQKEPDHPNWGSPWAQDACSRAARSAVSKRNRLVNRNLWCPTRFFVGTIILHSLHQ